MSNSKIEWTEKVWNPVRGCSVVSKGCTNCYAMKQAHRFSGKDMAYEGLTTLTNGGPVWTGEVKLVPELLDRPLHWKKPQRVFVNSMSDLFHDDVPDDFILEVFLSMNEAKQHIFQILTKRPERMLKILMNSKLFPRRTVGSTIWPLPNVWLGVSVEDQETANERIPLLLQTPAAVRWLSMEPLLDDVDLTSIVTMQFKGGEALNCLNGEILDMFGITVGLQRSKIDWVVVGGESGPGARHSCISWYNNIVHDCKAEGVPVFVKQLGAKPYETTDDEDVSDWPVDHYLDLINKKGNNILEFPEYLKVREYPA